MNIVAIKELAYNVVDDAIEHVFLRFPEDAATRAEVYRHVAAELLELAEDLDS